MKTTKDQNRELTVDETLELHGLDDAEDLLELSMDSVVPACCEEGCQVEPDGTCEHGHRSILLKMGVI